jgi:ABC-type glycerol-3-phosphate transport system substrate-binding protein
MLKRKVLTQFEFLKRHKTNEVLMKHRKAIALLIAFIFVTLMVSACQNQGDGGADSPSGASAPGSTDAPQELNELTMDVWLYEDEFIKEAAELYVEKTGVKVNIQNYYIPPDWNSSDYRLDPDQDLNIYAERVIADLLVKSGADIYHVNFLDYEQLGNNGLLVDMSDWLDNDAELTNDVVFRDLIHSGKSDKGIFGLSIDFCINRLSATSGDEPILENKRRTWQEFFDEVSELDYTQDIIFWYSELDLFMVRFYSRASYFIDESKNTQKLYSEEMISLLEECKDWNDRGFCWDIRDVPLFFTPDDRSNLGSYIGAAGGSTGDRWAETFCTIPEEYRRSIYTFAPLPNDGGSIRTDGKNRYPEIIGTPLYSVNAGSPKAEAAMDFLKFLLSEDCQRKMLPKDNGPNGFLLPVNRAVFRDLIESDLERIQKAIRTVEMDIPELIDEAEETVDEVAYFIIPKPYYNTIIREVAKEFFLDQISAEEAARQMSDKVGLYLKEQG